MRSFKLALLATSLTTLLFGSACVVRPARVGVAYTVATAPPPPRYAYVEVRPGWVWIDGYWNWGGYDWVWVDGYYIRERPGYYYVQGSWLRDGARYRYRPGYWSARRGPSNVYIQSGRPRGGAVVVPHKGGYDGGHYKVKEEKKVRVHDRSR